MRYLLTLTLLIIIATGCKKEVPSTEPTPVSKKIYKWPIRLSEIELSRTRSVYNIYLSYDEDGYLSDVTQRHTAIHGPDWPITIHYKRDNEHKILQEEIHEAHYDQIGYYEYNSNGKVGKITYKTDGGIDVYKILKWQGNSLLEIEQYNDGGSFISGDYFTYNAQGNIISAASRTKADTTYWNEIIYDNSPNPTTLIKGMPITLYTSDMGKFQNYTQNNVKSLSTTRVKNASTTSTKFIYVFNNLGYPDQEKLDGGGTRRVFKYEEY